MTSINKIDEEQLLKAVRQIAGNKSFKVGDEVTGLVTGIEDYGVFLENYETRMNGLIHKRNVSKTRFYHGIEDLESSFKIGDTVTAKVVEIRDGKLSLCTFDYELPSYGINSLGSLIKKEDIKVTEKPSELDEIYEEMRGKVGGVSAVAKPRVAELVGKYGLVKFSMALAKALETYTPIDQSVLLVEEIEKHAGVNSPKRTFIIGSHVRQRWQERGDGGDLLDRLVKARLMFEDLHLKRRLYGDDEYTYPCAIGETGENHVKTVEPWGQY
jgi:RecJ-like exonuclease